MAAPAEEARPKDERDPLMGAHRMSGDARPQKMPSILGLVLMTVWAFPIAVIWCTMALVVLPSEAVWLFPTNESIALGIFLVTVGVSQLVCPIAGLLSDRHQSRWGRRRPFIVFGSVGVVLGTAICWWSTLNRKGYVYILGLLVSMVSLNIIYSAQASIVPDMDAEKKGEASGIVAVLTAAGNLFGMTIILLLQEHIRQIYPIFIIMVTLSALTSVVAVKEKPTNEGPMRPVTYRDMARSFYLDTTEHRDFFWVCVGRALYYMATSALTFMFFFLRDSFTIGDDAAIRSVVAQVVTLAMVAGIAVSFPLGWMSDSVGRKPLVYAACIAIAVCYYGWLGSAFLPGFWGVLGVFLVGGLYGAASSCYQSVDYALALDVLPRAHNRRREKEESDAESGGQSDAESVASGFTSGSGTIPRKPRHHKGDAEALGLWGVAGFVGSSAGPLIGGLVLESVGGWGRGGHYTFPGYTALLSISAFYAILSAVVTRNIVGTD